MKTLKVVWMEIDTKVMSSDKPSFLIVFSWIVMTVHIFNEYCDLIGLVWTEEFDGTTFLFLYARH